MSEAIAFIRPLRGVRLRQPPTDAEAELRAQIEALHSKHVAELQQARTAAHAEAKREAEAAMAKQRESLRLLIQRVIPQLQAAEAALASELEAALPELILAGIEQMLLQWQPDADAVKAVVRSMLAGLQGERKSLRLFLAPADKLAWPEIKDDLSAEFPGVELIEDCDLRSGECYVQGRFGTMDHRFASKLDELRKVLS